MATILLPIKPKYATKILNGEKNIEFRKSFPKEDVDKIVIYATAPISRIIGEVEVIEEHTEKNISLLSYYLLNKAFKIGITEDEFNKYYKNKSFVYYYKLGEVTKYDKSLKDIGINYAPQNFVYLKEEK